MNSPEFAEFEEEVPEFSEEKIEPEIFSLSVAGSVPLYYAGTQKYSRWNLQRLKNPNLPAYPPTYD